MHTRNLSGFFEELIETKCPPSPPPLQNVQDKPESAATMCYVQQKTCFACIQALLRTQLFDFLYVRKEKTLNEDHRVRCGWLVLYHFAQYLAGVEWLDQQGFNE